MIKDLFAALAKHGVPAAAGLLLGLVATFVIGVESPGGILLLVLVCICVVILASALAGMLVRFATSGRVAAKPEKKDP